MIRFNQLIRMIVVVKRERLKMQVVMRRAKSGEVRKWEFGKMGADTKLESGFWGSKLE